MVIWHKKKKKEKRRMNKLLLVVLLFVSVFFSASAGFCGPSEEPETLIIFVSPEYCRAKEANHPEAFMSTDEKYIARVIVEGRACLELEKKARVGKELAQIKKKLKNDNVQTENFVVPGEPSEFKK